MTSNKSSKLCEPMVSPERYHEAQREIEILKEVIIELNKKILELEKTPNTKRNTDIIENYMAFREENENAKEINKIISNQCIYCGSTNVQCMFSETINGTKVSDHYMCKDCHKEFNV